ncbi:MAG: HRDC domain-containing protein [Bacteroidota bacterium]
MKPTQFEIALNHDFEKEAADEEADEVAASKSMVLDPALLDLLKGLRRNVSKSKNVPPFVIFQDPSLEDMATQYPISMEDMANITGVSIGKAQRYGRAFVDLIKKYVDENNIDRPTEFVVKSVVNKSSQKVSIIQSIDRKIPLDDIAENNKMSMEELLHEIEMIVNSGTKLDINYYIEENMDEYTLEDIYDYFLEAETDSLQAAYDELSDDDDITLEEIQLVRVKFMSELAN